MAYADVQKLKGWGVLRMVFQRIPPDGSGPGPIESVEAVMQDYAPHAIARVPRNSRVLRLEHSAGATVDPACVVRLATRFDRP